MLDTDPSLLARLRAARRRSALAENEHWLAVQEDAQGPCPRLLPRSPGLGLEDIDAQGLLRLRGLLHQHGAVLLSGFKLDSAQVLTDLAVGLCGGLMRYAERSTPRRQLGENLYSATEYPAHQRIDLHNENSYADEWPGCLFFWCVQPANSGGHNLLADSRRVLSHISPATRQLFQDRKVLYRRELGPPMGMPWQYVFQCESREELERQCREKGYRLSWRSEESASLERVGEAIITHPVTGESSWFNHALFFHESSLNAQIRTGLCDLYGQGYLPHQSFWGDGSPIEPAVLDELRDAYRQGEATVLLQKDDVLIVDNLLMAHGRLPYEGKRDMRLLMGRKEG